MDENFVSLDDLFEEDNNNSHSNEDLDFIEVNGIIDKKDNIEEKNNKHKEKNNKEKLVEKIQLILIIILIVGGLLIYFFGYPLFEPFIQV